jgi:outer membrane cobalamin receptor
MKPLNRESDPLYNGKYLTYRPLQIQNAGTELKLRGLEFSFYLHRLGTRYQTEENTKSLPPVDLYNFEIKYSLVRASYEIGLEFSVLNLTDKQYEILERQPERPREFKFEIQLIKEKRL